MILLTSEEIAAAVDRARSVHIDPDPESEFARLQSAAAAIALEEVRMRNAEGDPLRAEVAKLRGVLRDLDATTEAPAPSGDAVTDQAVPTEAETRSECAKLRGLLGELSRNPDPATAASARSALDAHAMRLAAADARWICAEAIESLQ